MTNNSFNKNLILQIQNCLNRDNIISIYLFGSFSKGASEYNDTDIFVIVNSWSSQHENDFTECWKEKYGDITTLYSRHLKTSNDILYHFLFVDEMKLEKLSPLLRYQIFNNGNHIYGQKREFCSIDEKSILDSEGGLLSLYAQCLNNIKYITYWKDKKLITVRRKIAEQVELYDFYKFIIKVSEANVSSLNKKTPDHPDHTDKQAVLNWLNEVINEINK